MSKMLATFVVATLVWLPVPAEAEERLRLPTDRDAQTIIATLEGFINRRVERVLPGPVEDREVVLVGSDAAGTPLTVAVRQRLMLHGIGDFFFRVPGPAASVVPLPESESSPGIRRGSVLWQGFCPRKRLLASEATLFPEQEVERLPLRVSADVRIDGEPLGPDEVGSGALEAHIVVENVTSIPVNLATARVDRSTLARTLDAVRQRLTSGERPVPGEGSIPKVLISESESDFALDQIKAAFDVQVDVDWTGGTVSGLSSSVGRVRGASVGARVKVGGGGPPRRVITITGQADEAGLPDILMVGDPAPPPASTLDPPGARSWKQVSASRVSNVEMFELLMQTMWRSALLVNYDAYLGNPDADGVSATTYRYTLTVGEAAPDVPPVEPMKADMVLAILALIALLLLLAAASTAWSLA